MKRALHDLLAAVACAIGIHHLFRWLNRKRLLIVAYHGVVDGRLPDGCPEWHHLDRADFERQLGYLAGHYRIVPIDDALQSPDHTGLACITFDDGYVNNRTHALPVLHAARAPATIYLTTGLIGSDRVLWTVKLEAAIRLTTVPEVDLETIGLGMVAVGGQSARIELSRRIIGRLKRLKPSARDVALISILDQVGLPPDAALEPFQMLTWRQVADMEATGLTTFGGHTVHHEIVSNLDQAGLESEVRGSITAVRNATERPSATFAYPNGGRRDFTLAAKQVVQSAGSIAALSTIPGLNDEAIDRYELRRIVVGRGMTFNRFRLATAGVLSAFRKA